MNVSNLSRLEQQLGYCFSQPKLLLLALTHRSFSHHNNERMEFLGDSILGFLIAEALFGRFPGAREGQLSRLRAKLVKGQTLATIARRFSLGDWLQLGSGELKSGGFRRESILADSLEAVLGAIYLDGGIVAARKRALAWFADELASLTLEAPNKDAKTRLQEFLQSRGCELPQYQVLQVQGEPHQRHFVVECSAALLKEKTQGQGGSRRIAEQLAARAALIALGLEKTHD
ncbi:ribonuclease III [Ventosimonas gracilis]|uniref:Ribonuclease 3 n=1 Tax=Ventosimonas gracilis TaxID=1680762 RepID=A0A139SWT2_9GAMM|nr:ribonuclease III [Ventosimonas gracilis]KXU39059.1 ribonuclease III [Ventosimonas gracilis]